MTFFKYLKEQLRLTIAVVLISSLAYCVSLYFGWREPIVATKNGIICFIVTFVLVGALGRYFLRLPPREL